MVAGAALAGCSSGVGIMLADPGRYSVSHCKDLFDRMTAIDLRVKQLQELMLRAREGTGGTIIGELSYRPEYEQLLTEKKLVRSAAVDKKCILPEAAAATEPHAPFQSDGTIR